MLGTAEAGPQAPGAGWIVVSGIEDGELPALSRERHRF
jgi:hypothetical protein